MGAEVLEAITGRDALAILEKGNVDVALLDPCLPDIPMIEVRNKMRAMPAAKTTRWSMQPPPRRSRPIRPAKRLSGIPSKSANWSERSFCCWGAPRYRSVSDS